MSQEGSSETMYWQALSSLMKLTPSLDLMVVMVVFDGKVKTPPTRRAYEYHDFPPVIEVAFVNSAGAKEGRLLLGQYGSAYCPEKNLTSSGAVSNSAQK